MNSDQIRAAKAQFKHHYIRFNQGMTGMDCGIAMAVYIRPELGSLRSELNRLAEVLREHDPEFPTNWTPL